MQLEPVIFTETSNLSKDPRNKGNLQVSKLVQYNYKVSKQ